LPLPGIEPRGKQLQGNAWTCIHETHYKYVGCTMYVEDQRLLGYSAVQTDVSEVRTASDDGGRTMCIQTSILPNTVRI